MTRHTVPHFRALRLAATEELQDRFADTVRGLSSRKGFLFADRGEFMAKEFQEPVRVYEVSWQGQRIRRREALEMNVSDKIRFLRNLRAVRNYTDEQIPDDVLNDILEVGRWSGSASNRQPLEVVVVRDAQIMQRMSEVGARPAAGAAAALVVVMPDGTDRHDLNVFDSGRLVERLLLAADAHGIGSNIATLKEEGPDIIREMLGIPAGKRLWTVVTLGYTDDEAHKNRASGPAAGRKPANDFGHWDTY